MTKKLLSINCLTYLHSKYLAQCIEGFLMQETNFEFEINICDDCSPDDTPAIVNSYIKGHPKGYRIKYYRQPRNLGMMGNGLFSLNKCKSKYIALCEGDDYWTDPLKLQKQVDFLEANDDYSICFHKVKIIDRHGIECSDFFEINTNFPLTTGTKELARRNYIPTASAIFRNVIGIFPDWFYKLPMGDWPLFLLASKKGKIGFIDEFMAVYRYHSSGIWSSSDYAQNYLKMKRARHLLNKVFEEKYKKDFFQPEDMYKNQFQLLENLRSKKKFIPYFYSFITLLSMKKHGPHSWGYYYLLISKYWK